MLQQCWYSCPSNITFFVCNLLYHHINQPIRLDISPLSQRRDNNVLEDVAVRETATFLHLVYLKFERPGRIPASYVKERYEYPEKHTKHRHDGHVRKP